MMKSWERRLKSWEEAGLIDPPAADRIRDHESEIARRRGVVWPIALAWVFGAMLVCAGVLLFVAANWDRLSPAARFSLVLVMVAAFHCAGTFLRERQEVLGHVLHVMGTVALGAGIYLSGQIFNLAEHWPGALMLWAAGAWIAWYLLRDRAQAVLAAILTPVWLASEWIEATAYTSQDLGPAAEGTWLLCFTYLAARTAGKDSPTRHDLVRLASLTLIPLTFWVIGAEPFHDPDRPEVSMGVYLAGWIVGYGVPLALAWFLCGRRMLPVLAAAAWVRLLGTVRPAFLHGPEDQQMFRELATYALCAVGSGLMAWWGTREGRPERINLGVAGFGLTVLFFYFDNVLDKLGRSVSLMGMGALLLLGGYALERTRRRLLLRSSRALS